MRLRLRKNSDENSISKVILMDLQNDISKEYLNVTPKNLSKIKNNFFILSDELVLNKSKAKRRLQDLNNKTYNFNKREFCFLNLHNRKFSSEEIIKTSKYANIFGVSPFYLFIEDDFVTPYEMLGLNFKKRSNEKIINKKINKIIHILRIIDKDSDVDSLSTQKFYNYFLVHRYATKTNQSYIKVMYDLFADKSKLKSEE